MPSLEGDELLIAPAAAESKGGKPMLKDIGKAHLCRRMETEEFLDLPAEREQAGKRAQLRCMRIRLPSSIKPGGPGSSCVAMTSSFIMSGGGFGLWRVHGVPRAKYLVKFRGVR